MKSDLFSPSRFAHYMAYEVKGGFKTFLMTFLALIGGLLFPMLINYLMVHHEYAWGIDYWYNSDVMYHFMQGLFIFGLCIVAVLGASMTFANLSKKDSRVNNLSLPASQLEKFIVRWLIFIPFALAVFILSFEIVETIRVCIVRINYPDTAYCHRLSTWNIVSEFGSLAWASFVLAQAVFVLGSIIWPRRSVIKTIIALICILILIIYFGKLLNDWILMPYSDYNINIEPDKESTEITFLTFEYVLAAFLYVIAYFRLKEIEIIQRW